jgi:hypothetical protein
MPKGLPDDSDQLRREGQKALARRRKMREINRSEIMPVELTTNEHYHLVYFHPKEEISVAHFEEKYFTQKQAFQALKDLGDKAEPNTEWYENGQIGIETRIHGMIGLHWIIAGVGMCNRRRCAEIRPVLEIITR